VTVPLNELITFPNSIETISCIPTVYARPEGTPNIVTELLGDSGFKLLIWVVVVLYNDPELPVAPVNPVDPVAPVFAASPGTPWEPVAPVGPGGPVGPMFFGITPRLHTFPPGEYRIVAMACLSIA
jgi:hypothetical protein